MEHEVCSYHFILLDQGYVPGILAHHMEHCNSWPMKSGILTETGQGYTTRMYSGFRGFRTCQRNRTQAAVERNKAY